MAKRPWVINANVINLLNNSAPVSGMRPNLGSSVQRRTIDIGCYPFPYMVDNENRPLDGTNGREVRPVPYWCSENAYAKYPGDTTYNNGRIIWNGGIGYITPQNSNDTNLRIAAFAYDDTLGVTYPIQRQSNLFLGLNNTVPLEWLNLKSFIESDEGNGYSFGEGTTLSIAQNLVWKMWTGLTYGEVQGLDPGSGAGKTYEFLPMEQYSLAGGTAKVVLNRYNYGCMESILYNDRFSIVGIDDDQRNAIWEGSVPGICFGASGGLTGELYLLNLVQDGTNSGSALVFGNDVDFPFTQVYAGAVAGSTFTGKQLALNIFGLGNEAPFLGPLDPNGGNLGFFDLFALLTATNQKIVTLANGTTASIRGLDFNNPCSDSFAYSDDSVLGQWGYVVKLINATGDAYTPPPDIETGCNIETYLDFLNGPTAALNGILHPLSVVYWKGVLGNSEYQQGYVHVDTGQVDTNGVPVYDKLEGMHDHLCYEMIGDDGEGTQITLSRVYYPLSPVNRAWYEANVATRYDEELIGGPEARAFGATLDLKYETGFRDAFKGAGAAGDTPKSIISLNADGVISVSTPDSPTGIKGVTGIMFPYLIPLATDGLNDIGPGLGDLTISGEFDNFQSWNSAAFPQRYGYYADGISSGADLDATSTPFLTEQNSNPDFRLFSWNLLSRVRPFLYNTSTPVLSSFFFNPSAENSQDLYGAARYDSTTDPNGVELDGLVVSVDLKSYLPAALQADPDSGLTFDYDLNGAADPIDCPSFITISRYANTLSPNAEPGPNGAYGLPAKKQLIAQQTLGAEVKTLADLDPDGVLEGDSEQTFTRTGAVANTQTNFYSQIGGNSNFFFQTTGPKAVFSSPYYLTAAKYVEKYSPSGDQPIWWENVDNTALASAAGYLSVEALAAYIDGVLIFPNFDDNWSTRSDLGFRGSPWSGEFDQGEFKIPGLRQALADGLHPAMLYRLMTTNIFAELGIETDCSSTWRSGGVPCHQIPAVLAALKDTNRVYSSYFNLPSAGFCDSFGQNSDTISEETLSVDGGKDFFDKCVLEFTSGGAGGGVGGGGGGASVPVFAYSSSYFSPFGSPYSQFQNQACAAGGGGGFVADPPDEASLTPFGLQFAKALNTVRGDAGVVDVEAATRAEVRDIVFAFNGSTATVLENGSDNQIGTRVSEWLTGELSAIVDYYGTTYTNSNAEVQNIESVLTTLFGGDFTNYRNSLSNSKTYRLWAIKPRCIDSWDQDCIDMANVVYGTNDSTLRFASFIPDSSVFDDNKYNGNIAPADRLTRPTLADSLPTVGNNTTPIRMNDIVTTDAGFLGAVRTVFVEPLGNATSVLATEAQAVPRATIVSTVYGKLTTIIDENGFLKDVNVLTLESGEGIRISGNTASGVITVEVDGLTLGYLSDTAIIGATTGDILVYNGDLGIWQNRPFADVVQPFLTGFTGSAGTNFFYRQTPPDAGITVGSRWMDSDTGVEYIYIYDGDGFQWIQAV